MGCLTSVLVPFGNSPVLRTSMPVLPPELRSESDRVKERPGIAL